MKKRKRLFGVLLVAAALIIMQLPVSEADAATPSASDFKIEGSTLVKYQGTQKNVSVPNTVKFISEGAFEENKNIERVVLPDSVEKIESYAFWGCDSLNTVVLGKGLTAVGDYAFTNCKGLRQMTIPSNVSVIGIQAFADCVNLRDITIPPETASIHETAFDGCYQLTIHCKEGSAADKYAAAFYEKQKEMPEYEDVPEYDPSDGAALPEIQPTPSPDAGQTPVGTEPQEPAAGAELGSTKVVGNRAVVFVAPGELNVYEAAPPSVSEQTPAADFSAGYSEDGIPKFTIVDGRIVADQAFYKDAELNEVSLPEGIREIGQFAFARSSVTGITVPQGVEVISYGAFYHCDGLDRIELPETVMQVEPKAFEHSGWVENFLNGGEGEGDYLISGGVLVAYRGSAESVHVPEGVRVIAAEVFQGHEEIKSVSFPESLRVIGEGAFEDCTGLREISLNQGLERILDRAFLNCAAERISVPASVSAIGLRALEGTEADYAGEAPAVTYEVSATRLSNEDFRAPAPDPEAVAAGVVVEEPEGASAVLEGAARSYVLRLWECQDTADMEGAFQRAFGSRLPEGAYVLEAELCDNSGIPLTKLGRQLLTVILPLPDSLAGQEVRLFDLDRNGQIEELPVELVNADGKTSVRFAANTVSQLCLCPTGGTASEPVEISVDMESYGAPPASPKGAVLPWKYPLGCIVLLGGVALLLTGRQKNRGK